jgi:hypothetical protein
VAIPARSIRKGDRLRDRATGRGGNRHPAHGADFCDSAEAEQSLKTRRYMNFKNNRQELGITLVNHVGYEQSRSAGKDEHSHVATSLLSHGEG